MTTDRILHELREAVIDGDPDRSTELSTAALAAGVAPLHVVNAALNTAMGEVSRRYETRVAALPDLILAGDAFHAAMDVVKPLMKRTQAETIGTVLIGTVQYDIHDLGQQLVATMLEVVGFDVVRIGKDVPAATFVKKTMEVNPDIIAMSALMTTTMTMQKEVIDALVRAGIRDQVKVMVGGAPTSQQWADKIGADGYGRDAIQAAELAKKLVGHAVPLMG